jgi:leucyl aminopeptidase
VDTEPKGEIVIDVLIGAEVDDEQGDLLVVPVLADMEMGPGAQWAADQLGDWITGHFESEDFTGKKGQWLAVPTAGALPYRMVAFLGVGEEPDTEALRRAAGSIAKASSRHARVVTTLHQLDGAGSAGAVAEGFLLGSYRFEKYVSEPKPLVTEAFVLAGASGVDAEIGRAKVVAEAVHLARDLANEPAVAKPPEMLAATAVEIGDRTGVTVEVWDERRIAEEKLGGLLGVASGSSKPPRLVVFRYRPDGAEKTLALVGKGIVFDSGGLSIKQAKMMEEMKTDMSGAAAVFGAVQAIATLGVPINVLGITPLTENMTGGAAQRPGDVLRARNGKTIEVLNTDAEGRLVLADGLSLAVEEEPDVIVDIATLTGACAVALGKGMAGMFTNDEAVGEAIVASGKRAGEKLWPMPLEREYRSHIDSPIADMKNTGERYGGAITAALLLAEFAGDQPWVHLDIAGPSRIDKPEHYLTKGSAGFGVRTLVAFAEDLAG